jgi:hypothetical protein
VWAHIRQVLGWWLGAHQRAAKALTTGGHRAEGVVGLGMCAGVDLLGLIALFFLLAMVVAPISGL